MIPLGRPYQLPAVPLIKLSARKLSTTFDKSHQVPAEQFVYVRPLLTRCEIHLLDTFTMVRFRPPKLKTSVSYILRNEDGDLIGEGRYCHQVEVIGL